jgi:hypothetical protein
MKVGSDCYKFTFDEQVEEREEENRWMTKVGKGETRDQMREEEIRERERQCWSLEEAGRQKRWCGVWEKRFWKDWLGMIGLLGQRTKCADL